MFAMVHETTKSAPINRFRFEIAKSTYLTKTSFCAAAIGSYVSFLIWKWTKREILVSGYFWPVTVI